MKVEALETLSAQERAGLQDLWVASWAAAMPQIDFRARRGWFDEHLGALIDGGADLLVLRTAEGEIGGFATLHSSTGAIDQLAVATGLQGKGIARCLLDEAKTRSPGALHLSVNQENGRAVALYNRAGFVVTGETVNARSGLKVWTMSWHRR